MKTKKSKLIKKILELNELSKRRVKDNLDNQDKLCELRNVYQNKYKKLTGNYISIS